MLTETHRLLKKKDFDKTFKQGKSFYGKFLGVKVLANKGEANRFGMVISSKVSKKAVERNKLKRQIREILQLLNQKIKPGFDLVVITAPSILGQNYQSIKMELEKTFFKLKLLK